MRPEENDIRKRFLSDEGAAYTLLFLFENGHGPLSSPLGGRFCLRDTTTKSFSTQVTASEDLVKKEFSM